MSGEEIRRSYDSSLRTSLLSRRTDYKHGSNSQNKLDLPAYPRRTSSRASAACQTCRRKKVRCDEGRPECGFCVKQGFRCNYRPSQEHFSDFHLTNITDQLITLERMVHHLYTKVELHERTSSTQAAAAIDPSANQTPTPSELREAAGATTAPFSYSNINRDACFNNEKEPPQESSCFLIRQQRTENKNASQAYTDGLEPNVSKNSTFPHQASLTMLLRQYFNNIGTLYPVICDIVAMNSASIIALKGYEDNINVCITLLLVALGKEAYNCVGNDGLAAFHGAIAMLNRLQFEFTLEFTQAEVLAGIYLYRKGKVLEAWKHIHGGCTTLYVMTKRELRNQTQRDRAEWNTILRLYWVSLNMEHDFLIYHPDLPPSQLSTLENSLALPLGCEESSTAHMKASARRAYTFFLAETGLKAILKRVPKFEKEPFPTEMGNADNAVRPQTLPAAFILSPVNDELDGQLSIWLSGVPTFLSWSPEPCLGEQAKVGTRLKLLYWFARLSLYNASIKHILDLGGVCFSLQAWGLVQDMLFAAQNCVHIFAFEECDPDPILQYRIQLAISTLESAMQKGLIQRRYVQDVKLLLNKVTDMNNKDHVSPMVTLTDSKVH